MWDAIKSNKDTIQEYVKEAKQYANEAKENSGAKSIEEKLQNKFYTKEEINQKLKRLPIADMCLRKEVDEKLQKKVSKIKEAILALETKIINGILIDYYKKRDCDDLFQRKGDYALKSDIPKPQDLTPYTKKADIYQENMIKLPDGTLIGIETKSGGVNNKPTPPNVIDPDSEKEHLEAPTIQP